MHLALSPIIQQANEAKIYHYVKKYNQDNQLMIDDEMFSFSCLTLLVHIGFYCRANTQRSSNHPLPAIS